MLQTFALAIFTYRDNTAGASVLTEMVTPYLVSQCERRQCSRYRSNLSKILIDFWNIGKSVF